MTEDYDAIARRLGPGIAGADGGPLAGFDFMVKDLFDVAGVPTQAGNPDYGPWRGVPSKHAAAVGRLLSAGARLVAKTHTHELAYGITGINPHFGSPVNPRAAVRICGGSSSGSAAAVAGGLVPFALGTDTAGSIRIPASFCGVFGYRPTHGRIAVDGVVPLAPSLDTVGVLAHDAATLERAAAVLLDEKPHEEGVLFDAAFTLGKGPPVEPAAERALARTVESVGRLKLRRGPMAFAGLADALEAQRTVQYAEAWAVHQDWIEQKRPRLGQDVAHHFAAAAKLSVAQIGRAISLRSAMSAEIRRLIGARGLLLLPATPDVAPEVARLNDFEEAMAFRTRTLLLNTLASVAGLPVVTVPVPARDGLYVGIQLIGPPGSDVPLLAFARRFF